MRRSINGPLAARTGHVARRRSPAPVPLPLCSPLCTCQRTADWAPWLRDVFSYPLLPGGSRASPLRYYGPAATVKGFLEPTSSLAQQLQTFPLTYPFFWRP